MRESKSLRALTPAQHRALTLLQRQGGEGAIDQSGKVVAAGVRLGMVGPETWLRLMTTGHVEPRGALRLGLTPLGSEAGRPEPTKVAAGGGYSDGRVPAHAGAE